MTKSKNEIATEIFNALYGKDGSPTTQSAVAEDEWKEFSKRIITTIESEIPDMAVYGGFTEDDIVPLLGKHTIPENELTELVAYINHKFNWENALGQVADLIEQYMAEK